MSDYIIITDSSCDLPHSLVQELELTVLPLSFIMDGKTYRNWPDNRDMSPDEFYSKEREGLMATTNAVNVGEAADALGMSYKQKMFKIILPQAFKAVLPTLANEFIVLLKETAVAGYVGLADITYAGNIIGGNCYDYLFPLLMSALIYLVLVMFFTFLVGRLERRLRNSER